MRLTLLLITVLAALLPSARAAEPARPNFLFIYTDDQRFDAMSVVQKEQGDAGRFPFLKTPNMDRLAAGGVRFRNAFVVNSLCSPSRANFLTGRYSHLNGVANNHTPFPVDSVTWATELRKVGYTTGYFGKWHMGGQSGQRPGFDFSASFVGQGKFFDCPIEVNGKSTPSTGWVDDVSTDYALKWIKENKGKPFAAAIGFKSSHGPWDPPERRKNDLTDAVSKPPVNADAKPPYITNADPNAPKKPAAKKPANPAQNDRSAMQRNYFRTLLGVDDNLGKLLDLLDELQIADNTVVVYSSDNGYYLGDHGLGDKRSAYDESLRVPFLVRYPKLAAAGSLRDEMVINVDLAPTFLDLAGAPIPPTMQGRSLKPLLTGAKDVDWRKAWFYHYFYERGFGPPTILAVRTETHKLIKYPGHDDWTELYDLKADPFEMKNLYADPASAELRKAMEAEFDKQSKAVEFRIPDYADELNKADAPAKPAAGGRNPAANRYVLNYDFTAAKADGVARIADVSTHGNNGAGKGLTVADGREGKKALKFDGESSIDIPKSPSLNPAGGGWSVQVTCRPDKGDGVIFASGGQTHGYSLQLQNGKPTFVVVVNGKATRAQGDKPITGDWHRLLAVIRPNEIVLYVDGQKVADAPLAELIPKEPNDGLQVGVDARSPVTAEPKGFVGLIESVEVFSGALAPKN